jgi:hypothetical protein
MKLSMTILIKKMKVISLIPMSNLSLKTIKLFHTLELQHLNRLEDVNAVDEDGNPVLQDGIQVINYGLKTEKKKIVKQQASGLLAPTDWYITKATEVADYDVPANILSFRAEVRTKSNEMETAINNAVDALKALYEYTYTGTRRILYCIQDH